jgi:hypothetical protein
MSGQERDSHSWRRLIGPAALALAVPAFSAFGQQLTADLAGTHPGESPGDAQTVSPFILPAMGLARERAQDCLTQAIYYEAATQPREGQEAVAQVVLNRVRHPVYPKTVCGVVYDGAGRRTGCQFTFVCDGSLRRSPDPSLWRAAEAVAAAALDGHVAAAIGASTHYHAVSVSPYWRASLVETRRIGAHIFYRMGGFLGSSAALSGRYGGEEPAGAALFEAGYLPPARQAPAVRPPTSAVSAFSVWGLPVATITTRRGAITVNRASNGEGAGPQAASPPWPAT